MGMQNGQGGGINIGSLLSQLGQGYGQNNNRGGYGQQGGQTQSVPKFW